MSAWSRNFQNLRGDFVHPNAPATAHRFRFSDEPRDLITETLALFKDEIARSTPHAPWWCSVRRFSIAQRVHADAECAHHPQRPPVVLLRVRSARSSLTAGPQPGARP